MHYAPDFSALTEEEAKGLLKREIKILSEMFGERIYGASTHEPKRAGISIIESNVKGFGLTYEAYFPQFFKKMKYISESGCRWREGCMCKFIQEKTPKLTILTHPFWWHEKSPLENY